MKIKELYIGSEKGRPPLRVSSMELIEGAGPRGEVHGKHQAGLWSAEDRALFQPLKEQALCGKRFFANIIIAYISVHLMYYVNIQKSQISLQINYNTLLSKYNGKKVANLFKSTTFFVLIVFLL